MTRAERMRERSCSYLQEKYSDRWSDAFDRLLFAWKCLDLPEIEDLEEQIAWSALSRLMVILELGDDIRAGRYEISEEEKGKIHRLISGKHLPQTGKENLN